MKELKYMRRFTTEVQYEFEEFTVSAEVADDDDTQLILADMKASVEAAHLGSPADGEPEEEETEEGNEEEDEDTESSDESEEEDEEEVPASKTKKTSKSSGDKDGPQTTGSKKTKKKPQVYQRTNGTHKEIFSNVLKEVAPKWKESTASKAKGKNASLEMEGEEFLDHTGEVVPSFRAAVKKLMVKK